MKPQHAISKNYLSYLSDGYKRGDLTEEEYEEGKELFRRTKSAHWKQGKVMY